MIQPRGLLRRLRLRHFLFILLLLSGIVPLAFSSLLLIQQNREILETQERSYLTRSAQTLSVELDGYLAECRGQLKIVGDGLLARPGSGGAEVVLREDWVTEHLEGFLREHVSYAALRILSPSGVGPGLAAEELPQGVGVAMDWAFEQVLTSGRSAYRFLVFPDGSLPIAVLATPVADSDGRLALVAEAALRLAPMQSLIEQEAGGDVDMFLIDRDGTPLWSGTARPELVAAVRDSSLTRAFVESPLNMTQEYSLRIGDREERMLGRVSPVPETGWGVIVHRPAALVYTAAQEMVAKTALSTGILVLLSLLVAGISARRLSLPIQRLVSTANEMAAGSYGKRIGDSAIGAELNELGVSFNRMSEQVERSIARLRRAAQANRELFLGALRAFAAAIDAKDPYTRGHSARVASYAKAIAAHLGWTGAQLEQVWVAALVHDIGKIGIDDALLRKETPLTDEEYLEMQTHTVIGARILSSMEQLKEVVPAVRGHHEAWNGEGYPDRLSGGEIPLLARVVAVADTLDAVTTDRPYQAACSAEYAVETITELAGRRFDPKIVSGLLAAVAAGDIEIETAGQGRKATLAEFEAAVLS